MTEAEGKEKTLYAPACVILHVLLRERETETETDFSLVPVTKLYSSQIFVSVLIFLLVIYFAIINSDALKIL